MCGLDLRRKDRKVILTLGVRDIGIAMLRRKGQSDVRRI
jgi:hypothetical protein